MPSLTSAYAGLRPTGLGHDVRLAGRLARAVADADGGFDADLLVGQIMCMDGHPEQAERRLAGRVPPPGDDARAGQLAIARVVNL